MPSSNPLLITPIMQRTGKIAPKTVLDIGMGFGKYGFLCREYLDICRERYAKDSWKIRIDGIEIFYNYIGALQQHIYNDICVGDACQVLKTLEKYDLILMIDVLEHIEKSKGFDLLQLIEQKSKVALIATPMKVQTQGTFCGNKYEAHISRWSKAELEAFGKVDEIEPKVRGIYLLQIGA